MKRTARTSISRAEAGSSVIELLTSRFTYHDREEWLELIRQERALVNGRPAGPERVLAPGDELEYLVPLVPEPTVNAEFAVVFEDDLLLVVDKPPNLPCHPAGRFFANTLWALLRQQPGRERIEFVNRLDRETSGLVLIAKTAGAAAGCREQFARRTVDKRYLAIVEGEFPERLHATGVLTSDAASPIRKKLRFVPVEDGAGETIGEKRVETGFRLASRHDGLSLVEAKPETGRTHQIRASLAGLGFPIVGDKLYGIDEALFLRFCDGRLTEEDRRRLRLDRQALHAAALTLRHPGTREPVSFSAPTPPDMAALLTK